MSQRCESQLLVNIQKRRIRQTPKLKRQPACLLCGERFNWVYFDQTVNRGALLDENVSRMTQVKIVAVNKIVVAWPSKLCKRYKMEALELLLCRSGREAMVPFRKAGDRNMLLTLRYYIRTAHSHDC